ncbi:Hpt domain-containing protein [Nocardioides acrostichi]|uniref:Hpt domain-containing protein n=1 Tax=Nocardioides acrostichi TaxID=2784339 RepID=A0A930V2N7_9ACTN|nr:Hpt domain-containing protein [Nocardioides acrostichi]MBF4162781.1 Hpt domain-containing protein [Nocardioides acrostichi]
MDDPLLDAPLPAYLVDPAHAGVLEPEVLVRLGRDVGDPDYPWRLVGLFLELLPGRVQRVLREVSAGDDAAADDALLSLKVSATAVGLPELSSLARRLENLLRTGNRAELLPALDALPATAARAEVALGDLLRRATSDQASLSKR